MPPNRPESRYVAKCAKCDTFAEHLTEALDTLSATEEKLSELQQLHDNFVTIASYELARALQARKELEDAFGIEVESSGLPN